MGNMEQKEDFYKVSVICYTYNQSQYIEDALKGFCMQRTEFPFVCTIVDDASTDGEQEVLKHYLEEHFDLGNVSIVRREETDDYVMTFAQHKENHNCFFALFLLKYNHRQSKKAKLPYIAKWIDYSQYRASCEGDDYWIDPEKLAKQVKYLEEHPKCTFLFTARYIKNEVNHSCKIQRYKKKVYSTHDILSGMNPGIQNVLFPKDLSKCVKKIRKNIKGVNADRIYPYVASTMGEVHYMDTITSVYRVTGKGVSTSVKASEWFYHASKDFYHFHQVTGANDKWAYRKGMAPYLGYFYRENGKQSILHPVGSLYKVLKGINPSVTRMDCLMMILIWLKRKIEIKFNCYEIKETSVAISILER